MSSTSPKGAVLTANDRRRLFLPPNWNDEQMLIYCWACREANPWPRCKECGAPEWDKTDGPDGVYIVQDPHSGLVKIGYSTAIPVRIASFGRHMRHIRPLWGASLTVERWLHELFAEQRDPVAARDRGLPAHTEWFWSSPQMIRLAWGEPLWGHAA